MPERLDEQAQKRLDDFVENLAFDLDYRFRGRRREYGCNAVWHIVPADRITENGYVWPSKYTWEYS